MKKVLIIGGTGTISFPITKKLMENSNVDLYVLNRGKKANLTGHVTSLIGDIHHKEEVEKLIEGQFFDCIINFIIYTMEDAKTNVELFKGRCKQFIYVSTNCVLDHRYQCLINEESLKANQYSNYGIMKGLIEDYFQSIEDFPLTIVRPTQTYSEDRFPLSVKGKTYWGVVQRMIDGKEVIVHGDGQSVWASTHANDFAKGFVALVGNEDTVGEIYQIMNPEPTTWDMIYQALADVYQVEYKPVYISTDLLIASRKYNWKESILGDKHFSNVFDISKIRQLSDVKFDIDIRQGAQLYKEFMDQHPERKIVDEEFDQWCDRTIELYKQLADQFKESVE